MKDFEIKDSGQRKEFSGGMVRDAADDKVDYLLALDGPMFKRWAAHMTKGAKKYSARNWMKANGEAELEHAKKSLGHHFIQYLDGETDEDHASAIFFNINLIEYVRNRMKEASDANSTMERQS
jgi:dATP/dGTP diphosphohydrolase